ncbi:hypothetical protein [Streptomyces cupreus]|uniref:Uncharacterized protein n=1 Tax=Streptomyces cupreus TaxID=2759956 RepID=A0A7X1MEC1_9ACTN|nr:hypothetical protein [Streptomyces cupreus]MBC2908137.1 hypothetical protein [Streptomyces cupreus]
MNSSRWTEYTMARRYADSRMPTEVPPLVIATTQGDILRASQRSTAATRR